MSCIPPAEYRVRFRDFMCGTVVDDDDTATVLSEE